MVKNRGCLPAIFVLFILVVLFTSFASASFAIGNKSNTIDKTYGAGESIRGWVNLSFNSEPSSSLFQDSAGHTITLIDLLRNSTGSVYSCSPTDCSPDYNASNGATTKTFALSGNGNDSKVYGLKFTGDLTKVNSINFTLDSTASESCVNQLEVDILNDGTTDVTNNKVGTTSCSSQKNYGCFNPNDATEEFLISSTPYCQKVNLSASPGFNIGAWVKRIDGSQVLKASIYDGGREVTNCVLSPTTDLGEISCSVNYVVSTPKEYYVCVYSTSGTGTYKVKGNSNPVKGCGFNGLPPPSSTPGAYQIFAEGKGFDAVGTLQISNSLPNGKNLGSVVYDYILKKYGSAGCSSGCVVPIKFKGSSAQTITLRNLAINYQKTIGTVTDDNFHDLSEAPARVSSGFQSIYLNNAGFSVPNKLGLYAFSLKLNGNNIFSENVNISDVPRINSLSPMSTASAYPTDFKVSVNSSANVSKFFWDFGDSIADASTTSTIKHTYNATGNYTITVNVVDTRGMSSTKAFNIVVVSPKNLINATLVKIKENTNKIGTQTSGFDMFSQESINSILEIQNVTQQVANLETRFNAAQTEAEYNQIVTDVLKINALPRSVSQGIAANFIPLLPDRMDINLDIVRIAGGGNYDPEKTDSYTDAVLLWNQENIDSSINFKEFVGNYDAGTRSVVKTFEISVKKKADISGSYFLIMPKMENLKFESGVVAVEGQDYVYVDVSRVEKVSFYTTENVDFTNLPAFISPALNRLSLSDAGVSIQPEEKPKWMIFGLAILFLLIIAFVVYIVLQEWYKRKYENYLFKNRNDLYNMVNYVHNSKKKGMKNKEIAENLKKAKWHSEQITYVMRKYAGERTGMLEIPLFGLFGKKKENQN